MNLKKNVLVSLLLALGLIFSQITPPFLGGMRFDFLLSFMFISIILTKDFKTTFLIGVVSGILSAFTTSFPGGELPNILEKIIVSYYVFFLVKSFGHNIGKIKLLILSLTGTFLSGVLFLFFASIIVGLPASMLGLIVTVVIPATIFNGFGTVFLYTLVNKAFSYNGFKVE